MRWSIAVVAAAVALGSPVAHADAVLAMDEYSTFGATARCVAVGVAPGEIVVAVHGESLNSPTAVECRVYETTRYSCDRYVGSVARKLPGVTAAAAGAFRVGGGEICLYAWASGGIPITVRAGR